MPIAQSAVPTSLGSYIASDPAVNSTVQTLTTSATQRVYRIMIDNRNNTANVYLKLWNALIGSVTVGTTAPDAVFYCRGGKRRTIVLVEGMKFGTAISLACVTTGGTGGTTKPPNDVPIEILYGS